MDNYTLNETEVEHILYVLRNSGCEDYGFAWNKRNKTVCKEIEMKLEDQLKLYEERN